MHKHLQLVPFASAAEIPVHEHVVDTELYQWAFLHYCALAAEGRFGSAGEMEAAYRALLQRQHAAFGTEVLSYNLLFTAHWMMLVPRKVQTVNLSELSYLSLNSFAFAGFVLVRSDAEAQQVQRLGLCRLLSKVCYR